MSDTGRNMLDVEKVARGAGLVFFATFVGLGLNYVYSVVLARYLGPQPFGYYSIALGIFNLLSVISLLGFDKATLHFLPKSIAEGRRSEALSIIKLVLSLSLSSGLIFGLTLFFSSDYLAFKYYQNEEIGKLLRAFAIAIPAFTLTSILIVLLQSFHDVRTRMAIKYVSEPILKFVVTLILFALGWQLGGAMVGILAAMWISVCLGLLALKKHIRNVTGDEHAGFKGIIKPLIAYILPLIIGILFNVAATRADILLIGSMIGAEQAGIYAAAFQSAAILGLILFSVEQVIAPMLSEVLSGNRQRAKEIYALSLRWPMILGMPLFTIFVVMAPELMGIFGTSFRQAAPCFIVLLLGQMVALVTGSSNYILLVSGHSKVVMMNELIGATLLFALNFLLIPRYGIIGAAIAVGSNYAIINILRMLQVRHYLKLHPYEKTLWKPAVAGIIVFIMAVGLRYFFFSERVLWLVPIILAVYVAVTALIGVNSDDKKAFAGIVHRFMPGTVRTPI